MRWDQWVGRVVVGKRKCRASQRMRRAVVETCESRVLLSTVYDYTVLAKTGQLGLTSISSSVSVNDAGAVAFVGQTTTGAGLYAGDGSASFPIKEVTPAAYGKMGVRDLHPEVQINDSDQAVLSESETSPTLYSSVSVWNTKTGAQSVAADGSPNGGAVTKTLRLAQSPAINNKGDVAYHAVDLNLNSIIGEALPGNGGGYSQHQASLGNEFYNVNEMVADTGDIVFQEGNLTNSPIVVINPSGGKTVIAASANYSYLGSSPSISRDGKLVAFYGDNSSGPQLFLAIDTTSGWKTTRVAALGSNFTSFEADTRVAVNTTEDAQHSVTVVFEATSAATKKLGIYSMRLNFAAPSGGTFSATNPSDTYVYSGLQLVAAVGQSIPGVGTITDLDIWDPVNSVGNGQVAFWAAAGSTEAVVRATFAKWTMMYYLDGAGTTDAAEKLTLEDLQKVGSNDGVSVIVLYSGDTKGTSAAYYVAWDGELAPIKLTDISSGFTNNAVDMGSPASLTAFGEYAVKNYPADHYFLDPSDHGGDWYGACSDDVFHSLLSLADLRTCVQNINAVIATKAAGNANASTKIDILSYVDDCSMASYEVAASNMGIAGYMVASEPETGYTLKFWTDLTKNLETNVATITPEQLATSMVTYIGKDHITNISYGVSAIDLNAFSKTLLPAFQTFAGDLLSAAKSNAATIKTIRLGLDTFLGPVGGDTGEIIDLYTFAAMLKASTSLPASLKTASGTLMAALKTTILQNFTFQGTGSAEDKVREMTGMSIFAPVAPNHNNPSEGKDYVTDAVPYIGSTWVSVLKALA